MLRFVLKVAKYKKQKALSRISRIGGDGIFDTKTLNFAFFEFFNLRDQLVVANSKEQVYFEKNVLALLFVHHQTDNLSRMKFAHISRQVKGLRIS